MKKYELSRLLCLVAATLVGLVAAVNMALWLLSDYGFIQTPVDTVLGGFNRSLCFMAGAVGLACIRRYRLLTLILGAVVFFYGFGTLCLYLPGMSEAFDANIGPYFAPAHTNEWTRMTPNTTVGMVLLGAGLFLSAIRAQPSRGVALCVSVAGSIISALGIVPLLDLAAHGSDTSSWQLITHMRFPTALGFVLCGVGLVAHVHSRSRTHFWVPISVGVGFLVLTFTLYTAIHAQENTKIDLIVQGEAANISSKLDLQLLGIYNSLNHMARRWNVAGGIPLALWEDDGEQYTHGFASLTAISMTNAQSEIIDIVPVATMHKYIGYKLDTDPERNRVIQAIVKTNAPQSTHVLMLRTGNMGFLYMNPLMHDGAFDGVLLGVIETEKLFDKIITAEDRQNFSITVHENGVGVYTTSPHENTLADRGHQSVAVANKGLNWTIDVVPTEQFIDAHDSLVDTSVLIIGIATAFLISMCTFLALKFRDQSDRLKKTELLNNAILDGASVLIVASDLKGTIIGFNPAAEKSLGYSSTEVINRLTPAIWHVPDEIVARAAALTKELGYHIEPGFEVFTAKAKLLGSDTQEWTYIHKSGFRFTASLTVTPLRDANGEISGFMGISRDTTLERMQQQALKASEETFRSAMENASIGMALISLEGRFLRVNPSLCKMLGYTEKELTRKDFQSVTHPEDIESNLRFMQEVKAGEAASFEMEKRYINKVGGVVWVLLSVSLARRPDGSPNYYVTQIHDITERRQIQELKDEFVSVVSHELRTPLTSIRGSLGLVTGALSKGLPTQVAHLISIAHKNAERLILLINDILDMDQIAAGKMRFELKRERVGNLLHQAIEANKAYADNYNVSFRLEPLPENFSITVDAARFIQAMTNLLSNAAKFSKPHTFVVVSAYADDSNIRINVKDTGPGIPEEFQSRIFGKFLQADSSVRREKGGTGLGLHITREIVTHMKGKIGFDTTVGRGTTFWLDFVNADHLVPEEPISSEARPGASGHLLICEDDFDVAEIMKLQVDKAGFTADIALSIAEAREKLAEQRYKAVLLDLAFPKENGVDLIRELRSKPATVDLPIVVVSARAEEGRSSLHGDAIGVVDWLMKPIDARQLITALARVTKAGAQTVARILHIEDDTDLSKVLATALEGRAEIVNVATIREARERLLSEIFSLVVLDIVLPDGNGLGLVGSMTDASGSPVPVLILSAEEAPRDIQQRVASAMVKSRMSETKIVETILSLIPTIGDSHHVI